MQNEKNIYQWFATIGIILSAILTILEINDYINGWISFCVYISLFVMVSVYAVHLHKKLKNKEEFIQFIAFLFTHRHGSSNGFSLLPKICIELDKTQDVNKVHITELELKSTCYLENEDKQIETCLTDDGRLQVKYTEEQEYILKVKNENLPPYYSYYVGNVYSEGEVKVRQKHGNMTDYGVVHPESGSKKIGANPSFRKYPWKLSKENFCKEDSIVDIEFKMEFRERENATTSSVIIIYPKRYGETVEKIKVELDYRCSREVLVNVQPYEIAKRSSDGSYLATTVGETKITGNKATITFRPNCGWTDAYYIMVQLAVPVDMGSVKTGIPI